MNKVRTIVIDGVEIQTSLSAVEIASLPIKIAELEQENQELKQIIKENTILVEDENGNYQETNIDTLKIIKENQSLKKQLEEYKRLGFKHLNDKCNKLENQQKQFIEYLENEIYNIEPKGTRINYNCEYDSEEDYISAMKEQSELNTLKEILSKYKEIIGDDK